VYFFNIAWHYCTAKILYLISIAQYRHGYNSKHDKVTSVWRESAAECPGNVLVLTMPCYYMWLLTVGPNNSQMDFVADLLNNDPDPSTILRRILYYCTSSGQSRITGLAQGPVRDGGIGTHWSFPTGSSLPSPYRAQGLCHLPALPQRRRDGRASGVPVPGP